MEWALLRSPFVPSTPIQPSAFEEKFPVDAAGLPAHLISFLVLVILLRGASDQISYKV